MNSRIILNLNLIFKNSKNLNKSFYTINNKCARKEASLFRSKSNNQFQLVRLNSTVPKSFKERYFVKKLIRFNRIISKYFHFKLI